jgi:hypothetical protein
MRVRHVPKFPNLFKYMIQNTKLGNLGTCLTL